ncbi:DUF4331 family protein [Nocardiopsis potens]|uniref:DUF4331 family protein n=1 Tax=Nocardiopsis potens TaxID=1246458 RepID=UPI000344A075|nr:DUF4331 family protein [Nocardiopsis potens]
MSHHLDSPEARQDPRLDISDVYLFRGSAGTVFVMNVNPLSGGGGFHHEGMYEFKVDTDGDAVEDTTFRLVFGEADADGRQPVELRRLDGADAADRDAPGVLLGAGRTEEEIAAGQGIRLWAGAAADPFYIEGSVVTAVVTAIAQGTRLDLSGFDPAAPANLFAGTDVSAIVLEVPDAALGADEIGFWGVSVLATDAGGWRQINRCAQPLVNTLFNPADSERADEFNHHTPAEDREMHGEVFARLVSRAVAANGTAGDPDAYAERVCAELLPDLVRYRVGTPAHFGFAHRNGRGLTEAAPEAMFALVLNKAVPLGLDASSASGEPRAEFPYLSLPVGGPVPAA